MSSGNDRLILWTSSVAKAKLWTLLHFSKEVQQHTDVLLEAALLSLDSSGAFSVGLWPALSGTWASRKGAEFEKFHQVTTWAQAMLQLAVPILRPGQLFRLLVDQHQVRREQARAQLHLPALLGRVAPVALLGRPGSQDGWGHGRSGHRDCRNGGHYPCGSGISGRVRGSHCFGFGPNARCFGYALSDFGGAGLAPAGAALVSDGTVPPEAELLAQALHDSLATTEGWDMAKCAQACADLVHEAAKLRSQLTLLKGIHPFGKLPMKALEANAFPAMVYALPELAEEECELDELPTGKEATVEHWRAFVHILQARVGEFQRFVKSKVPSFPLTDVMPATFFKKRKRVTFDGEEEEARAAGGGSGLLPPLDAARREHLAALGSTFKTVNEEQLVRALRGELAPEEMVRPPGAGAPSTAIPSRGPLAGVNLLVAPVQHLQQEDEGIKWKDGDLTVVPKSRKCKDMAEWERGFLRIMCEAPAEARDDLVDFVEWAKSIAADYNFFHFFEFYEHLIRQVQRSAMGISLDGYDRVWRMCTSSNTTCSRGSLRGRGAITNGSGRMRTTVRALRARAKVEVLEAGGAGPADVAGALQMLATATTRATAGISLTAISSMFAVCAGLRVIQQAPAGAEKDPAVETDTAPEVEKEIEMEDVLAETEGVELADMEADVEMSPKLPAEVVASERWWADLRADEFIPVWDVLGGPRRHARVPLRWEVERIAPLPVTHTCPDTWRLPEEPGRVRMSTRWPALREKILQRATIENMEACGKGENERRCYEEEGERVGCSIPTLTSRAPLVAVAFQDWHDVDFLVRCAACGAGWPSGEIEVGEPNRVPNYVGPEHMDVMRDEIRRESEEGRIFRTRWRLPLSIIALGMVEKVRKGKVKYRPVSDQGRGGERQDRARQGRVHHCEGGVRHAEATLLDGEGGHGDGLPEQGDRVHVLDPPMLRVRWREMDGCTGAIRRPGAPRHLHEVDEGHCGMDARAGDSYGGYLDDFFCILETKEHAEEVMLLLVEFMTFMGFKVNSAKCEGPAQVLEFLGVLLSTEGDVCTASIDEERIAVVVKQAGELRARAARGMVSRRALESLLGLLAFCSHVVWGLSLCTRRGFNFLAATTGRRMVRMPHQVLEDLAVLKQVVRQYRGKRVVLERRLVDERDFATDASGTLGVWEKLFFILSWADLARLPQRPWFPSRVYEFGPFTVDACVAESKANSYCYPSWSRMKDARVQKFDGHNAWGNLPFSGMLSIIENFLSPWPGLTGREGWAEELVQKLQREAERYRAQALAPETRRCYGTGVRAFVIFCISFASLGCLDPLLPATDKSLCMFITYFSWFVQPDTIKNYLAGVRQLHLQRGHEWVPVAARHAVAATPQGVKRCWERPPKPEALWAAILVGFFGLFRKDNLTTGKAGAWNTREALVRDDILFQEDGSVALFVMEKVTGRRASVVPMTHDTLVAGIKARAEHVGLDPASYAGHSLRRGGATAAKCLDVNSMYIKMQGDWKSDCFERYYELGTEQKLILLGAMAEAAAALL
eukprot:gene7961-biopygen8040